MWRQPQQDVERWIPSVFTPLKTHQDFTLNPRLEDEGPVAGQKGKLSSCGSSTMCMARLGRCVAGRGLLFSFHSQRSLANIRLPCLTSCCSDRIYWRISITDKLFCEVDKRFG